ncbi:hypothetical protein H4S08_002295 [Coemansia sp. RSA 1365]|nr:hypothetical protein H4S08_002295 [Coemansia sp. RSA 1365]
MFASVTTVTVGAITLFASSLAAPVQAPGTSALSTRCGGCGGWGGVGGWGGWGFPFASSFTNNLNSNANCAHFNDDTLYINNKDANSVNRNCNACNSASTIF